VAVFRISFAATRDLDEQFDYLAEREPSIARRYYAAARTSFQRLADMPGLGALRDIELPNYPGLRISRISGFPNYLIFYVPVGGGIEVIRVIHGARDVMRILRNPTTE